MINKIICSTFFVLMLLAVSLSLFGVTHVEIGGPFLTLMKTTSLQLSKFKIAIPDIPLIPIDEIISSDFEGGSIIFEAFISFAEGFFNFINVIIKILNILSSIINIIIELLQFIVILIKNIIEFRDILIGG